MKNIIELTTYDTIEGFPLTHLGIHKIEHRPRKTQDDGGYIAIWLRKGFLDEGAVQAYINGFMVAPAKLYNDGIDVYFIEGGVYDDFVQVSTTGTDFRISDVLNYLVDSGQIDGTVL